MVSLISALVKNKDSLIDIKFNALKRLEVPKEMLSFYDGKIIKRLGKKISEKEYYEFDNFICKIKGDEIEKAYYNIQYLKDNPNILP